LVPHAKPASPAAEAEAEAEALGGAEADAVGVALVVADAVGVGVADALALALADAVAVADALALADAVAFAVAEVLGSGPFGCASGLSHATASSVTRRRGRGVERVIAGSVPFVWRNPEGGSFPGPVIERTPVELIAAKRDGHALRPDEIRAFIAAYMKGDVADYQMAAWLMAAFFRGLDDVETVALTEAMLHSGAVLDLASVPGKKVDKHSTGGVGDKVSICLAPLVAACGVPVPMVSGRGLGHTGGTLDKLEAIPGFRTTLATDDFRRIVGEVGACMIGQTKDIAPADKRIYALRDVTATVECIPLIVASILSKKLAEGIDGLVLDVKVGAGAFMKDEPSARALATALVRVGRRAGKNVVAVLTRMDAPLGREVGNANETREALEVLHGRGPADLVECTMVLGVEMLLLGGVAPVAADARAKLEGAIASGAAARVMEKMVAAQGGDAAVVADPSRLRDAAHTAVIEAERDGFVQRVDALAVGLAAVAMGAGRTRADQNVDPSVGITIAAKPGERVARGAPLAELHLRDGARAAELSARVRGAFTVGDAPPEPAPLVVGRVD
jgi:pyrimidine-nucleoside phosphorylase